MDKKSLICFLVLIAGLFFPSVIYGDMSSSTYRIYADVISIGGGLSNGTSYDLQGTGGESMVGSITSSTFEIKGGFQYMELDSILTLNITSTSLDLGTLSASSVSTVSTTAYITTNNSSGYTLSISGVSGTALTAVSDGEVSTGTEEYGVAVSGTSAAFSNDQSTAPKILGSNSGAVTNDKLDLFFKASISPASTPCGYSQALVVTVAANP